MIKAGFVVAGAFGCAILASPACAQSEPLAQQTPHTDILISARALYDGNVVRGTTDLADQRGLEKDDFRVTPSIDADVYKTVGAGYLSLTGSIVYRLDERRVGKEWVSTGRSRWSTHH